MLTRKNESINKRHTTGSLYKHAADGTRLDAFNFLFTPYFLPQPALVLYLKTSKQKADLLGEALLLRSLGKAISALLSQAGPCWHSLSNGCKRETKVTVEFLEKTAWDELQARELRTKMKFVFTVTSPKLSVVSQREVQKTKRFLLILPLK